MAVQILPIFTSAIADDPVDLAAGRITPSRWNAGMSMTLADGKLIGASGSTAAIEITVGGGLSLSSGTLSVSGGGISVAAGTPDATHGISIAGVPAIKSSSGYFGFYNSNGANMVFETGASGVDETNYFSNTTQVFRTLAGAAYASFSASGIGFNGATPFAKPTLPAAATDLATALTLVNAIRTALISYGLAA